MKLSILATAVLFLFISEKVQAFESEHQWTQTQVRLELWNFGMLGIAPVKVNQTPSNRVSGELDLALKELESAPRH